MDHVRTATQDSDAGSWRLATLAPERWFEPLALAVNAYQERDTPFRRRRELPDGSAVLIVNLGAEIRVEHPIGAKQAFATGRSFFSGASSTYAVTETDGAQEGAQFKFTLLGARLFLNRPLSEFGDALVETREAMGPAANEFIDRLGDAPSPAVRIGVLAEAMRGRIDAADPIAPELAYALRRLQHADARIADVAREIGYRRERLAAAFRREFGLSPKRFARIRRFARALRAHERNPSLDGAALAAHCGYVDQAHMAHDFREFSGAPPAALWRRELRDAGGFVD